MINIDYDKNKIILEKINDHSYNVILKNDLILTKGEDTILNTSIALSFDNDYENVEFNGNVADESELYDNIFVSSSVYNEGMEGTNDIEVYFYNGDKRDVFLPEKKSIGTLNLYLSYSENFEKIIEDSLNQKIIYDNNGLKVIPTEEYTESINKTELEVDSIGNKVLKIYYPPVEIVEESEEVTE